MKLRKKERGRRKKVSVSVCFFVCKLCERGGS